jgi:erythronate-4-phosphate dehydrogenase
MRVLVCDPPLQKANSQKLTANSYVSLDEIERNSDIITFHVPLTRKGQYATWHLADDDFFHRLSRVPYIINTSRGEVVDNKALLSAMEERRVRDAIIDVWEDEPHPDSVLLEKVFIGTPHIAGYSADGKVNADNMVIDAICQHFSLPHPGLIAPPKLPADFTYSGSPLDLYNPMEDSKKLKAASSRFEQLRNNYPLRREKMG